MCEQNSTLMPMAITRLTRVTALSWMFHHTIMPIMLTRIMVMRTRVMRLAHTLKPDRTSRTMNTAPSDVRRVTTVLCHIVK